MEWDGGIDRVGWRNGGTRMEGVEWRDSGSRMEG